MDNIEDIKLKKRKEKIMEFMREDAYKPLLIDELVAVFDVPKSDRGLFQELLDQLETEGKLIKTNRKRYGLPSLMNIIAGKLRASERGFAFLLPDDEGIKDVFISAEDLNGAMNNDRVFVKLKNSAIGDKRAEGEVEKIITRANTTVVGRFEISRNFGFVISDDKRISIDIFISKNNTKNAKDGDKVVVEITKWPEKRRNPEGKIIDVIGSGKDPGVDILSIIKSFNLNEEFPDDVLEQAENIPAEVSKDMLKGRRDLRDLKLVTIDGEDAKDLDDAVSIEKLPNGYRLGVHIADVSHYVTEDSPLDKEALKRGTSVYLVDRVIPMLPRKLSNGICSLNPKVDRLAFSVMMDIDASGKLVSHDIFDSVIKTCERMTYTDVFKILVEEDEQLKERYDYLLEDFNMMKELALILKNKRKQRGAIDFDFQETKVVLDEKGTPIEIKAYIITLANQIIEEFMLVCNETVAEHFYWANVPFVYRVHEEPDPDKMTALSVFLTNLGYSLKGVNKIHPKALQDVIEKCKDTKEERIISTIMLRSLKKARYTSQNDVHFGLAAKYYSHFTSPIRRYPDLIIHRIMKEFLKNKLSDKRNDYLIEVLPEITRRCSENERTAEVAERESKDLKKVEYMKMHEGEVFTGVIANVTSFGFFVELPNTIEGLVKISSIEDDYYIFDDKRYSLTGERTRKTYKIGDEVNVLLARADIPLRQIDFVLVKGDINEYKKPEKKEDSKDEISKKEHVRPVFQKKPESANGKPKKEFSKKIRKKSNSKNKNPY